VQSKTDANDERNKKRRIFADKATLLSDKQSDPIKEAILREKKRKLFE